MVEFRRAVSVVSVIILTVGPGWTCSNSRRCPGVTRYIFSTIVDAAGIPRRLPTHPTSIIADAAIQRDNRPIVLSHSIVGPAGIAMSVGSPSVIVG